MSNRLKFGGEPVAPRRYAQCFNCNEDTVQWLVSIYTNSPGSYRGTRLRANYVCTECGDIEI